MTDKTSTSETATPEVPMEDLDDVSGGLLIMPDGHTKILRDDWTTPETAKARQSVSTGKP